MIAQDTAASLVAEETFVAQPVENRRAAGIRRRHAAHARPRSVHRIKAIHSRRDIDAILQRECARCERNGHEFSLVVIGLSEPENSRKLSRMARLLCRRARTTDEIGWYDSRRLCVVLPDTGDVGSMAFVRRFTEMANHRRISPICNVLGYHGQAHSENERMSAEEMGHEIDEVGEDICPDPIRRLPAVRIVNAGDISNLLIRPLPMWKRVIDLVGGSLILLAAMPFMACIALAIKISDRGPVLFRQRRSGLGGKPFTIFKFRTMVTDAEAKKRHLIHKSEQDGPAFKIKHDPRITRVGRILRETSLDELPQLFNVLKGDMSLVGPRPLPVDESERCATWHRRRLDVTPGLTCIWQIKGRSTVSFADWIRMDRRYIQRQSIWQDIKLILLTVPSVLLRRGR
jgi:lipopolysaccharide/colanic/teichoic acid biosynthesis glycosyltransferase